MNLAHSDSTQRYRGLERVPPSPKVADILLVLLTHRGHVVEKSEPIHLVWSDTFVEEGGLTRNISALLRALGDDADAFQAIAPKSRGDGDRLVMQRLGRLLGKN